MILSRGRGRSEGVLDLVEIAEGPRVGEVFEGSEVDALRGKVGEEGRGVEYG